MIESYISPTKEFRNCIQIFIFQHKSSINSDLLCNIIWWGAWIRFRLNTSFIDITITIIPNISAISSISINIISHIDCTVFAWLCFTSSAVICRDDAFLKAICSIVSCFIWNSWNAFTDDIAYLLYETSAGVPILSACVNCLVFINVFISNFIFFTNGTTNGANFIFNVAAISRVGANDWSAEFLVPMIGFVGVVTWNASTTVIN